MNDETEDSGDGLDILDAFEELIEDKIAITMKALVAANAVSFRVLVETLNAEGGIPQDRLSTLIDRLRAEGRRHTAEGEVLSGLALQMTAKALGD